MSFGGGDNLSGASFEFGDPKSTPVLYGAAWGYEGKLPQNLATTDTFEYFLCKERPRTANLPDEPGCSRVKLIANWAGPDTFEPFPEVPGVLDPEEEDYREEGKYH